MKLIKNWEISTVADCEADGLLDEATLLHIVSYQLHNKEIKSIAGSDHTRLRKFLQYHVDNEIPLVGHNFIGFDIPLFEKILRVDLSNLMVIDTLWLSWALNTKRKQHGLDSFFEDYGVAKVKVADNQWAFVPSNEEERVWHQKLMTSRCEEDVKINKPLWEDLKARLINMYTLAKVEIDNGNVDGTRTSESEVCYIDQYKDTSSVSDYINRFLTFIMFKADCARLQEKTRWKADRDAYEKLDKHLDEKILEAKLELEGVMPQVPDYTKKNRPKKPYLKNGGLSASGESWNEALKGLDIVNELGHNLSIRVEGSNECLKVLKGYNPPNIQSSQQIKDWLFSHGWKPQTFKYVKDEKAMEAWVNSGFKKELKPIPRKIPQISVDTDDGKDLCPSVSALAEDIPEIMAYSKFTMIKHRSDTVKGFLRDMSPDGYLKARVGGTTNTFRVRHRELVNLVGVDKPYGADLRGGLICEPNEIQLGSDLSSLEDCVKQMFMMAHDPEYVSTMLEEGYDPHLKLALSAQAITEEEYRSAISGNKTDNVKSVRPLYKQVNYSCVYNIGADALSKAIGGTIKQAKAKLESYWSLNWSVKAIAEEQCVITCGKGLKWLINPINGFLYNIRKDSDRFSTLCQGTGSYFFDMWIDNILEAMQKTFGVKRLCGSFHDEYITRFRDTLKNREVMKQITLDAIDKVSETYMLRRPLGCDVAFGHKYSEIH